MLAARCLWKRHRGGQAASGTADDAAHRAFDCMLAEGPTTRTEEELAAIGTPPSDGR